MKGEAHMSKGKKFDAAEKYFEKQRIEYRKKIRDLEYANKTLNDEIRSIHDEITVLQKENEHLKKQNNVLMELKNINTEDVEVLVQSKKTTSNISVMLNLMAKKTW